MAKARATCTCATCGAIFEVTAVRNNARDARSFETWAVENITECKECEEKRTAEKRAEENAKAAAAAGERGWPILEGTEKQVAWATTIREQQIPGMIKQLARALAHAREREKTERIGHFELCIRAIEYLIAHNTKASWWIDNNNAMTIEKAVGNVYKDMKANPEKYAIAEAVETAEAEAMTETVTIAQPVEQTHEGVVDIRASEQRVTAAYRKDDDFRKLVKSLGYSWMASEGVWGMAIGLKTGTAAERAAELGNKLLNAGFAIRIQDAETLRNAIEGNYEPMTHRWIAKLDEDFYITWAYDDSFYDQARRLPGAKYKKPGMRVPSREYGAILDFAQTYDFRLTPGAQELVNEMQSKSTVVTPAAPKAPEYDEHPLSDVLNTSREVLDDLIDE